MPRVSVRTRYTRRFEFLIYHQLSLLSLASNEDFDQNYNNLACLITAYYHIQTSRYLSPRNYIHRYARLSKWFSSLQAGPEREFKTMLRMSTSAFTALVNLIAPNAIFHISRLGRPQLPVELQLAVFLLRMGMQGAGSSLAHTHVNLGLAEGSVHLYTLRVIEALQSIKENWIRWPTPAKRKEHAQRIAKESFGLFEGYVGFVDGTYVNLQFTPEVPDYYFYFNRKSTYAINATAICTDDRIITYLRCGDTSAVHDSTVFSRTLLYQQPDDYFNDGEYLIGDSAYTATAQMIPPFTNPRAREKPCRRFNWMLSHSRIVIEHTFGMLKARFPALTAMPIRIKDTCTHTLVVKWFEAGCVIHNFLGARRDELDWENEKHWLDILKGIEEEREGENNIQGGSLTTGKNLTIREDLLQKFIDSGMRTR